MKGDNDEDGDVEEEVLESKVVYMDLFDACIVTVLKYFGCEEPRGGKSIKK